MMKTPVAVFPVPELQQAYLTWSQTTGLTAGMPEWTYVRRSLMTAGLIDDKGRPLRDDEHDAPGCFAAETQASRKVQIVLLAAAHHHNALQRRQQDAADSGPEGRPQALPEGAVPISAVHSLAIAVKLLPLLPRGEETLLQQPAADAGYLLSGELDNRIIGLFPNVAMALRSLIADVVGAARKAAQDDAPHDPVLTTPLVQTILDEAPRDEVFAEHIFITLSSNQEVDLGFVDLEWGWLLYRRGEIDEANS